MQLNETFGSTGNLSPSNIDSLYYYFLMLIVLA